VLCAATRCAFPEIAPSADEEKKERKIRTWPTRIGHASNGRWIDRSDRTIHDPEVAISAASGGSEAFSIKNRGRTRKCISIKHIEENKNLNRGNLLNIPRNL
jgi:hypothetical protein